MDIVSSPQSSCADNGLRCSTDNRESYIRDNRIVGKRGKKDLKRSGHRNTNKDEIRGAGNVLVQCRTYARNVMDAQHVHHDR